MYSACALHWLKECAALVAEPVGAGLPREWAAKRPTHYPPNNDNFKGRTAPIQIAWSR